MIKIKFLLFLLFLLFYISQQQQQQQNEQSNHLQQVQQEQQEQQQNVLMNLYVNSNGGNDTIGNGTINNPYYSICKVIEVIEFILEDDDTNNDYNYNFTIYIGVGEYLCKECSLEINKTNTIINFEKMDFTSSSSSSSGSSSSNDNNYPEIINLNIKFSNSTFSIKNIKIVFNNDNDDEYSVVLFNYGSNFIMNESEMIIGSNLKFVNSFYGSNLIFENSIINKGNEDDESSDFKLLYLENCNTIFKNITSMNMYCQIIDGNLIIENCYFSNVLLILIKNLNATLSNTIFKSIFLNTDSFGNSHYINNVNGGSGSGSSNSGGSLLIYNCQLSFIKTQISFYLQINFQSKIIIKQSTLEGITGVGLIEISNHSSLYLEDVTFSNFKLLYDAFFKVKSSVLKMKNVNCINIDSRNLILVSNSGVIELNQISWFNKISIYNDKSLIKIASPSNVSISNLNLNFISPIVMGNFNDSSQSTQINITDSTFSNLKSLKIQNSMIQLLNVNIESSLSGTGSLISLLGKSNMIVNSCTINSAMISGQSFIFSISQSSSINVVNSLIKSSTPIINATDNSNVDFKDSLFNDLLSPLFSISNNSNLNFQNCSFNQVFTIYSSFIVINTNSNLLISNCTFQNISVGVQPLILIDDSRGIIDTTNMVSTFFETKLFNVLNSSWLEITNSNFRKISGYDAMFTVDGPTTLFQMENCNFIENSLNSLINVVNRSDIRIKGIEYQNNTGTFISSKTGLIRLDTINIYENSRFSFEILFYFENANVFMDNINISTNYFMGSVIESFESTIVANYFYFFSNENVLNFNQNRHSSTIYIENSYVLFEKSKFSENLQNSGHLFQVIGGSNIQFIKVDMTDNSIHFMGSYLIYLNDSTINLNTVTIADTDSVAGTIGLFLNSRISIYNSNFTSNFGSLNGGVIYFSNNASIQSMTDSLFEDNYAPHGGVFFTESFIPNIIKNYSFNQYIDNRSIYGDIIASNPCNITIKFPELESSSTISTIYVYDYYSNLVSDKNYVARVIITTIYKNTTTPNQMIDMDTAITAGIGTFNFAFNAPLDIDYFLVDIIIDELNLSSLSNHRDRTICNSFQVFNLTNGNCNFCPVGKFNRNNTCLDCNENIVCIESNIFSINGYYMIADIIQVDNSQNPNITNSLNSYQCPIGMCGQANQCPNDSYQGNLCSRCITDDQMYPDYTPSVSKNSIWCCKSFKPDLIIPYIVYIISFGMVLSFIKHHTSFYYLMPTILMLQSCSIIFHSYSGIYVLPLFRFSIDFIDQVCTFKINYIWKSIISLVSIMVVYIIGNSNLIIKLIQFIDKRSPRLSILFLKSNIIKSNLKYHYKFQSLPLPKQLRKSRLLKWNLFILLFQPTVFNLFSFIISKPIENKHYLMIDISILFNYTLPRNLIYYICFIVLSIITLVPTLFIIYYCFIYKFIIVKLFIHSPSSILIKNNNLFYNILKNQKIQYRNQFKWWDLILIIKFISFTFISIYMIYSPNYYLLIISLIQFIFTTLQFLIHPNSKSNHHKFNNLINLLQLILIIIIDSNIIKLLSFNNAGIFISSFIIFILILLILYKILILNNNNSSYKIKNKYK